MRSYSVNTKVREEGGRGGAPSTKADALLQPVEERTVEQIFSCILWKQLQ